MTGMATFDQELNDAFQAWLLPIMDERGLREEDIAAGTNSGMPTVKDWTRGKSRPYLPKCEALAEYLGLPPSEVKKAAGRIQAPGGPAHAPGWEPLTHEEHDHVRELIAAMPPPSEMQEPFLTDDERQAVRALLGANPGYEPFLTDDERTQLRRLLRMWAHVSDAEWSRIRRQAMIMAAMGDLNGSGDGAEPRGDGGVGDAGGE